jgi:hypothetical protein
VEQELRSIPKNLGSRYVFSGVRNGKQHNGKKRTKWQTTQWQKEDKMANNDLQNTNPFVIIKLFFLLLPCIINHYGFALFS